MQSSPASVAYNIESLGCDIQPVKISFEKSADNIKSVMKMPSLEDYLKRHRVSKDDKLVKEITNTRIGCDNPKIYGGSYHIPDEEYEEFLQIYYHHVFNNKKLEYLTEKQRDVGALLVDVDFRFGTDVTTRQYTADNIDNLIVGYMDVLKSVYEFDDGDRFNVFVMEKQSVNVLADKTKDGIHIIFGLLADRRTQLYIRSQMLEKLPEILGDLPLENEWNDVLDEGISTGKTNWQLFGSRKPNYEAYELTLVYDMVFDADDSEFAMNPVAVANFNLEENICQLSARCNTHPQFMFSSAYLTQCSKEISHVESTARQYLDDGGFSSNEIMSCRNKMQFDAYMDNVINEWKANDEQKYDAYQYVMCLPASYYGDGSYKNWSNVGIALKNTDNNLFCVWVALSSQKKGFNYTTDIMDLVNKWKGFPRTSGENSLSMGSICYWAKNDAPVKYNNIKQSKKSLPKMAAIDDLTDDDKTDVETPQKAVKPKVKKEKKEKETKFKRSNDNDDIELEDINWDLSEAEFAKMFKKVCFDDKPVAFTGKGKEVDGFLFNGVYWLPLSLHNAELCKENFDKLYKYYVENLEIQKCEKEMEKDEYIRLLKIIKSLNTHSTRSNIIKIFKTDNYVEKIEWNKNINLFVFDDAIYDLSVGDFVEPKTDDYININCGYIYNIPNTKKEIDAAKADILKFYEGTVETDVKDYLLKVISSFLIQQNKEEKAYFWLGKGRNSKGTSTALISNALGSYWGELNMEYYTTYKKRADEPNQNLFNCQYSRVLNSSEIAANDKSNIKTRIINDVFNRITGGDIINARELGTKTVASFKAGKILIQTNDMPEFTKDINKDDMSLRERIVVMNFPYSFTDDVALITENPAVYKLIDRSLKTKFDSELYRRAMIDIMFAYYKKYLTEGLIIPESIKAHTDAYFNTQNILAWFNDAFIKTDESNNVIGLNVIQQHYTDEFGVKMSQADLKKKLEKCGVKFVKNSTWFAVGYCVQPTLPPVTEFGN